MAAENTYTYDSSSGGAAFNTTNTAANNNNNTSSSSSNEDYYNDYDDPSLLMPSDADTSDHDDSGTENATFDHAMKMEEAASISTTTDISSNNPTKNNSNQPNMSTTTTTAAAAININSNENNNNSNNYLPSNINNNINNNHNPAADPPLSLLDNDISMTTDEGTTNDDTNNNNKNISIDNSAVEDDEVVDADDDGFDPFHIESTATKSKRQSRISKFFGGGGGEQEKSKSSPLNNRKMKKGGLLPPRLEVKFKISEEITSHPSFTNLSEGACDVIISGTVHAQQTSSDALKNSPFVLVTTSLNKTNMEFKPNEAYAKLYATQGGQQSKINVIKIPKTNIQNRAPGYVMIGKYTITETVDHMPLLLEKRITKSGTKIQMAFQVRSKLCNFDDLRDISIVVSLDQHVIGDSVAVTSQHKGDWDRSNRVMKWKLDLLPKGESFMVTGRARVTLDAEALQAEQLHFPVLMRCSSNDQISTVHLQAIEASGYPATISHSTVSKTFRLVHRLN